MLTTIIFFVLLVYVGLILSLLIGFHKLSIFYPKRIQEPKTTFSIVVPFRNENQNLPVLLESISRLNYPEELFEVLLIDDDSEEKFVLKNKYYSFDVSILSNDRRSNSPKKDAIQTAVRHARKDWIITTDADCQVPKNWLDVFDQYIQKEEVEMVAASVRYTTDNSFLSEFQQLDLLSLQGATIGSFGLQKAFMCNGANFAYAKNYFNALGGFEGNSNVASGDDVFLLQKAIENSPEKVSYLKSPLVIVNTLPVETWKSLFQQRVRWAAKTSKYQSVFGKLLGIMVFLMNIVLISTLVLLSLGKMNFLEVEFFWVSKMTVDFFLLFATNRFLKRKRMSFLLLGSFFYPFFSVVVATYSLFGSYEWKGRKFNY